MKVGLKDRTSGILTFCSCIGFDKCRIGGEKVRFLDSSILRWFDKHQGTTYTLSPLNSSSANGRVCIMSSTI